MPDVTTAATYTERLATARLLHCFSFGPTPGQYAALVKRGAPRAQAAVLARNGNDPGLVSLVPPTLPDIGIRPPPETAAGATFQSEINQGSTALVNWWLDPMTLAHYPLAERMTWFWHGHWATSISKVEYPLSMQIRNNTLCSHAEASTSRRRADP